MRAAEARERDSWQHTSAVLAMLVNTSANRDPKAEPASAGDFDPWVQLDRIREQSTQQSRPAEEAYMPIEVLKTLWVDNQPTR